MHRRPIDTVLRVGLLVILASTAPGFSLALSAAQAEPLLRGPNVIRLRKSSVHVELIKAWTEVIQGTKTDSGDCRYSIKVSADDSDLTPQAARVVAVDPVTCQFEGERGTPLSIPVPDLAAGVAEAEAVSAVSTDVACTAEEVEADVTCSKGSASNSLSGATMVVGDLKRGRSTERHSHNKLATFWTIWEDPVNAVVNQVRTLGALARERFDDPFGGLHSIQLLAHRYWVEARFLLR